jgi:ribonuclease Z
MRLVTKRISRFLIWSGLIVLLILGIAYSAGHMAPVQDNLIRRIAHQRLRATHNGLLGLNQISVVLCGTGVPVPDRDRASACTAVFVAGQFFLVDVGPSSARNVGVFGLPMARLAGVLLTHFHSDHIGDLGEINTQSWMAGRDRPLPVYGPPGVERVVDGFARAYTLDRGYRMSTVPLLSAQAWMMEARAVSVRGGNGQTSMATVLDRNGLKIIAFTVDHAPVVPAYGYRFDYRGRSIVISGDTAKSANLIRAASGADLLIHEAEAKHMITIIQQVASEQHDTLIEHTLAGIQRYHSSPIDAANVANQAGIQLLVMTHLAPPPNNVLGRWVFLRGVSAVRPNGVELGFDGMLITLRIGSNDIRSSSLN